jgi:hypothetical protein
MAVSRYVHETEIVKGSSSMRTRPGDAEVVTKPYELARRPGHSAA